MEAVSDLTGGCGPAMFPVRGPLPNLPHSASMEPSFETYVRDGWIERDERYRLWPALQRRGVATEFDIVTQDEIARHPYYQEFLAPYGLRWCALVLVASGEDQWSLSIQRSIAQGPFARLKGRGGLFGQSVYCRL